MSAKELPIYVVQATATGGIMHIAVVYNGAIVFTANAHNKRMYRSCLLAAVDELCHVPEALELADS